MTEVPVARGVLDQSRDDGCNRLEAAIEVETGRGFRLEREIHGFSIGEGNHSDDRRAVGQTPEAQGPVRLERGYDPDEQIDGWQALGIPRGERNRGQRPEGIEDQFS